MDVFDLNTVPFQRSKSERTFSSGGSESGKDVPDVEFLTFNRNAPSSRSLETGRAHVQTQVRRRKQNPLSARFKILPPDAEREFVLQNVDKTLSAVSKSRPDEETILKHDWLISKPDNTTLGAEAVEVHVNCEQVKREAKPDMVPGYQQSSVIIDIPPTPPITPREAARVTFTDYSLDELCTEDCVNNLKTERIDAPSPVPSYQSSNVGLDWLFSNESESSSVTPPSEASSTTLTNEDDLDTASGHPPTVMLPPPPYGASNHDPDLLPVRPCRSKSLEGKSKSAAKDPDHKRSSSMESSRPLTPMPHKKLFRVVVPENAELERQRAQGAIPKRRPVVSLPERSDTEDLHEDGQLSPDITDTVELSRRLLEILDKTHGSGVEQELRKLREELRNKKSQIESTLKEGESVEPRHHTGSMSRVDRRSRAREVERRERKSKIKAHRHSTQRDNTELSASSVVEEEKASSSRESSASNHNENTTLLKGGDLQLPDASGHSARESRRGRRRHSSRSSRKTSESRSEAGSAAPTDVLQSVLAVEENKHLAKSHNDTTEGAVHCFQDEFGNWFTYSFGEGSSGIAATFLQAAEMEKLNKLNQEKWDSSSDSTVIVDPPDLPPPEFARRESVIARSGLFSIENTSRSPRLALQTYMEALMESGGRPRHGESSTTSSHTHDLNRLEQKPKFHYKFYLVPWTFIKVRFDRLALIALLDKNNLWENLVSVILALTIGVLGGVMLSHSFYRDFLTFLFCFVIAGCQYSLLKSVQPDAASPMHGYNRMIVFSRAFYFCLCSCLVLVLHYTSESFTDTTFTLYGLPFTSKSALVFARDLVKIFLLCFPVIFTIGLLPQINTFLIYVIEQIEIHVFGGHATTSLASAVFTLCRSVLVAIPLYGFCYAGITEPYAPDEPNTSQHVIFSVYCGLLVPLCYHLSRSSTDTAVLWELIKSLFHKCKNSTRCGGKSKKEGDEGISGTDMMDPLPKKLQDTVLERMKSDLIVCMASSVFVFAVSVSTAFSSPVLQPVLQDVLVYLAGSVGFICHYLIPQLRKEMPWLYFSMPVLPSHERSHFEVQEAARVMWFERAYCWLRFFERNVLCPAVFLSVLTTSAYNMRHEERFSLQLATLMIVICSLKMFRSGFSNTPQQYFIVLFTHFAFRYDLQPYSETFLIDYFFVSILVSKLLECYLKWKFVMSYIAPWQIPWGSAFHAFAQPISVPHSAMLVVQTLISAFFSTPLNPLLGSAIFFTSYARPVKFWERDYNTKRVDHTNTRLSSQLDRNPGTDDNNLNSIFYEHLTRSLQHSLCGDLSMGRWGPASQGDCFVIASDYLNALVHIIEMGNGLVTFQLRGLEFRGTYCQQREVEAITEGVDEDGGCCCCEPGHLPFCLSLNSAFNQRWLAWEVVVTKYVLEGYSISDNSAASMLQMYDLRKVLITYYVKSIIYYTVRSPKLDEWLNNTTIQEGIRATLDKNYVDLDPTFTSSVDEDYDSRLAGVTKSNFNNEYLEWIQYCAAKREQEIESDASSWLVSLCFALSLLGRRVLGTASHNNGSNSVEFFLYGLHALFKGDFRITSSRDEWVFADMEMLRRVVAPGVRMSLKLHQDHFTCSDEYDECPALYDAITSHEEHMVISHEADPAWRNAVLANVPSLLALRHVLDEGADEYKIIMLNKRHLSFRVIKVNRECVRGLWAGQQQELVFLRNRNPERGSIQNAKQALRNMINSSCDQPIGYPIYVSPLTTSYSGTHSQYSSIVGSEFSLRGVVKAMRSVWHHIRVRCGAHCQGSGSSSMDCAPNTPQVRHGPPGATLGGSHPTAQDVQTRSRHDSLQTSRRSFPAASINKPNSAFVSLAGLLSDNSTKEASQPNTKVQIADPSCVFDNINQNRRIDVLWPNEEWRQAGGKNKWNLWRPEKGMEGHVVHRWAPCHREQVRRSHVDKHILLVQIGDKYVPIAETGVTELNSSTAET